jgi:hypothetical protein
VACGQARLKGAQVRTEYRPGRHARTIARASSRRSAASTGGADTRDRRPCGRRTIQGRRRYRLRPWLPLGDVSGARARQRRRAGPPTRCHPPDRLHFLKLHWIPTSTAGQLSGAGTTTVPRARITRTDSQDPGYQAPMSRGLQRHRGRAEWMIYAKSWPEQKRIKAAQNRQLAWITSWELGHLRFSGAEPGGLARESAAVHRVVSIASGSRRSRVVPRHGGMS